MDAETRGYFEAIRQDFAQLRGEFGEIRSEVGELRGEVGAKIEGLRLEILDVGTLTERLRGDIRLIAEGVQTNADALERFRADMHAEFRARDAVLHAAFTEVRRDLADLRQRL